MDQMHIRQRIAALSRTRGSFDYLLLGIYIIWKTWLKLILKGDYFTGTPKYQNKNENCQSRPFLVQDLL